MKPIRQERAEYQCVACGAIHKIADIQPTG
jgi:DNA-directed RNA polymerase subunit RPC12/RpoP